MTETFRLFDLASMISEITGTRIAHVANPRNEPDENELAVKNEGLLGFGLNPTLFSGRLITEMTEVAQKYAANCDRTKIRCVSLW